MKQKISTFAKEHNLSYLTVYNMVKRNEIPSETLPTGTILILTSDIKKVNRSAVILYARVSSSENKDNLDSQMKRLRLYAYAKGYIVVREVKEIGSGLNDKRNKLASILEADDYSKIIVEHKDRLARFGTNYIKLLLKKLDKDIEIINEVEDNSREDVMQDFVSIITSFTARLYGLRRSKRKTEKLIKELQNEKEED